MRKAERLFQVITILRGRRRVITAEQLAEILEVSERTIYRDVQALILSGVPIEGEAGVGYRLKPGFDIPPLMFTTAELESLVIGARMVQAWTDQDMAQSATRALEKIIAVSPPQLQHILHNQHIQIPNFQFDSKTSDCMRILRTAITEQLFTKIDYTRLDGEQSQRQIKPLGLFYWGLTWTLVAWCELRTNFRVFRIDRIGQIEIQDNKFEIQPNQSLNDYLIQVCGKYE